MTKEKRSRSIENAAMRIREMAPEHPFWMHVSINSLADCWAWKLNTDKHGYGIFGKHRAHRVAFELSRRKDLKPGQVVRHRCDNPGCCNPAHLLAGSQLDNINDRNARGRTARGQDNGRAVLDAAMVLEIFQSKESASIAASRYGVAKWTVTDIRSGRNWGWLTGAIFPNGPGIFPKAKRPSGDFR